MIRCVVHWGSDITLKASQGLPIRAKPFQHPALQEIVIHLVFLINGSSTPGLLAPKTFQPIPFATFAFAYVAVSKIPFFNPTSLTI